MTCQNCGTEHSSKYCPECGVPTALMQTCAQCGHTHTSKFCPECGASAGTLPAPALEPSEPVSYYQHPPQYQDYSMEPMPQAGAVPQAQPMRQPMQAPVQPVQPTYAPPMAAPTLQAVSAQATPTIIINNSNENTNTPAYVNTGYPPAPPGINFTASPKSKVIALLLCIFFGYWGVHYFYVGKIGKGLVYLLTFGLFGIGWLIDIARIFFGSFRDAWGYPLVV